MLLEDERSDRGSPWNLYFAARAESVAATRFRVSRSGVISGMTCGHWMSSFMMGGASFRGVQNEESFL